MKQDFFMPNNEDKPKKRKGYELSMASLTRLVLACSFMVCVTMGTVLYGTWAERDRIANEKQSDATMRQVLLDTTMLVKELTDRVEEITNAGTNVSRN